MPYDAGFRTVQEDEERKKRAQGWVPTKLGPEGGGPLTLPNGGALVSGTGGDAAQSAGRVVNFGTWFNLNKGAAGNMAGQVTGAATGAAKAAQGELADAKGKFNQAVQAGSMKWGNEGLKQPTAAMPAAGVPGLTTKTQGGLESAPTRNGTATGAYDANAKKGGGGTMGNWNAPAGAITPAEMQARADTKYSGPNSLGDSPTWADMMSHATAAQSKVQALQTQEGRQAALADMYANTGSYAGGMGAPTTANSRLDAALSGVAGAGQFADANQRFGNLAQQFTDADVASQQQAKQAGLDTAEAAAMYRDKLAGAAKPAPSASPVFGGAEVDKDTDVAMGRPGAWGSPGDGTNRPMDQQSTVDFYLKSNPSLAGAVRDMTETEYAKFAQGSAEGDPWKYLPGYAAAHGVKG